MLDMALQNADCIVISSPDDLTELEPMLHPDDSDAISELLAALASGKPVTARKFRLTRDGGASYRWWQFRPSLKKDSDENGLEMLESLSGIVIDINDTELYNDYMREAALVAEEITNKETFLMNISHEIRVLPVVSMLNSDGWTDWRTLVTSQSRHGRSKNLPKACTLIVVPVALPSTEYPAM